MNVTNEAVFPWQFFLVITVFAFVFMLIAYSRRSALFAWFSTVLFIISAHMAPIVAWDIGGALTIFPSLTILSIVFWFIATVNGIAGMVFLVGGEEGIG